jgi:hypothetical protein
LGNNKQALLNEKLPRVVLVEWKGGHVVREGKSHGEFVATHAKGQKWS